MQPILHTCRCRSFASPIRIRYQLYHIHGLHWPSFLPHSVDLSALRQVPGVPLSRSCAIGTGHWEWEKGATRMCISHHWTTVWHTRNTSSYIVNSFPCQFVFSNGRCREGVCMYVYCITLWVLDVRVFGYVCPGFINLCINPAHFRYIDHRIHSR